jgi:hypothetical protein
MILATRNHKLNLKLTWAVSSVADPDPYVFGPPGSGSVSQRFGSGSRILLSSRKKVRKTLIPAVLGLLYEFYH